MLRPSLALVLLLLAPACNNKPAVDPAEQAEQLKKDLANAKVRIKDDKFKEAEEMLNRVLAADPANAEAQAGLGRVRLAEKQYDAAVVLLEQAATKLTEDPEVQAALGETYKRLERHADAANAWGAAFKADPNHGNYGLEQGQALRRAKQLDAAEAVLREVAKTDKQTEFVFTELGDVLREQGKLDEALKTYMKALIEHAGDKSAHAGAALVYELQNNTAKAIDEWSTYIRMDCCSEFSTNVAKKHMDALRAASIAEGTPAKTPAG